MSGKEYRGQWDAVAIASVFLLVLSFVLGGHTRAHALRLAIGELSALPLLVLAAGRLIRTGHWREHRLALGLLAAIAAIPLVQLIPLPPAVWTGLPGRDLACLLASGGACRCAMGWLAGQSAACSACPPPNMGCTQPGRASTSAVLAVAVRTATRRGPPSATSVASYR